MSLESPPSQPITPRGALDSKRRKKLPYIRFTFRNTVVRVAYEMSALRSTAWAVALAVGIPFALYAAALTTLVAVPSLQAHAIYLHKATPLTWFHDLNVPEQFGFAHHQVTPFFIPTPDGERLHAWHVLPDWKSVV